MKNNLKSIWVTWEIQRRNRSLSQLVNSELFEIINKKPRIIRYTVNIYKTLVIYISRKPDIIFVQNPSFLLASVSVLYGKVAGITVIVDAHNAGIYPMEGKYNLLNNLAILLVRVTPITLVSNKYLAEYVNNQGGQAVIIPDPLPDFKHIRQDHNEEISNKIIFICTWAEDEPYEAVINAASLIDNSIEIYITGDSKGREKELVDNIPENITLTGFLPDDEYIKVLSDCDAVVDLTTRENCLVCGAYEAVELGKPLILSDTVALRDYFTKGVIFIENKPEAIANAIKLIYLEYARLINDIRELKDEIKNSWEDHLDNLEKKISETQ